MTQGRHPLHRPGLEAGALFALLATLGAGLVWQADRLARAEERQAASYAAATAAFGIEQQLSRSLSFTYALAAVVRQHGGIEGFDALAAEMLPLYGGLFSLQLAPGCVVSHVFPLRGNEAALGHDLLRDPDRRFQARAAVESRQPPPGTPTSCRARTSRAGAASTSRARASRRPRPPSRSRSRTASGRWSSRPRAPAAAARGWPCSAVRPGGAHERARPARA
ncbi:MAG TPA: hypothetical protein VFP50_00420, partial [Anaeromyxobacteraceae bacterium]|nr:hypothetical protein [Anaeromyxobacteraceae bacterium]